MQLFAGTSSASLPAQPVSPTPTWLPSTWKRPAKLGINVHVEKQGSNGIDGRITDEQLDKAVACVFAAEVAVKESERFAHLTKVETPVTRC